MQHLESFPPLLLAGALLFWNSAGLAQTTGVTNAWTKPTSGAWEEPYWSLGRLPGPDQQTVAICNPGWKAVAINPATRANYPESLVLNNLVIDAPPDSYNQLLFNWASLEVPLVVCSNLCIGTNGSLASHYTSLRAANLFVSGSMALTDASSADFGEVLLTGGTISLINGSVTCSNLVFDYSQFNQQGGSHQCGRIQLPRRPSQSWYDSTYGDYLLSGGALVSGGISLGWFELHSHGGFGYFEQTGGTHTNGSIGLGGAISGNGGVVSAGHYTLGGGLLVSDWLGVFCGSFLQTNGTAYINELIASDGEIALYGGELISSNCTVRAREFGYFNQTGGVHTVLNRLHVESEYWESNVARYEFKGGTLNVPEIDVGPGGTFSFSQGTLNNSNLLVLHEQGKLLAGAATNARLGRLQVLSSSSTLSLDWNSGPSVIRFQDSHTLPWSGTLRIESWRSGYHHLFVGTNAGGLSPDQLARIVFAFGISDREVPAMQFTTGEVAPTVFEDFGYAVTNGTITIIYYFGPGGAVVVPGSIGGLPVTAIGDYAFVYNYNLTNVILPASISRLGNNVFYHSSRLAAVYFQGNAPTIGTGAFEGAPATLYYLPGTTGWGTTFGGRPTAPWLLPQPVILSFGPQFGIQANRFGFVVSWATNVPVVIEASTDLTGGGWLPLVTNTLTDGSCYYSDLDWAMYAQRFYRVRGK